MSVLLRLVVGIAAFALLSCSGSPSKPSSTTHATPQCSVRMWVCTSQYGAIAYSSGGGLGRAYDYPSQAAANAAALATCGQYATGCSVVVQFQNACGAIALAPTGEAGWASAQSGDSAQALALAHCYGQ